MFSPLSIDGAIIMSLQLGRINKLNCVHYFLISLRSIDGAICLYKEYLEAPSMSTSLNCGSELSLNREVCSIISTFDSKVHIIF